MSAVDAILPYQPREIVLNLPFPPSKNRLRRRSKGKPERGHKGGMYLSPQYRAWQRNADSHMHLMRHHHRHIPTIDLPFEAILLLNAEAGWGDVHNRIECVMDYAQRIEIIKNDSLCRKVTAEWVAPAKAPYGCRLIIREIA